MSHELTIFFLIVCQHIYLSALFISLDISMLIVWRYYARPVDYSGEDRSCENFGNRWLIALLLSYYAGMLREENDHEPKLIIYTSPA